MDRQVNAKLSAIFSSFPMGRLCKHAYIDQTLQIQEENVTILKKKKIEILLGKHPKIEELINILN